MFKLKIVGIKAILLNMPVEGKGKRTRSLKIMTFE